MGDFKYKHIMVDLETLGLGSTSVILSIGAVEFDIETGDIGEKSYNTIDIDSCIKRGLTIDGSTLRWWLNKTKEAKKSFNGNTNLECVLSRFDNLFYKRHKQNTMTFNYMNDCHEKINIWGNGARFDLGILANAYEVVGLRKPWNDKNEMDVRTLAVLAPEIKENCKFEGTEHNPLDVCLHQIKCCSEIWKKINYNNKVVKNITSLRDEYSKCTHEMCSMQESMHENVVVQELTNILENVNDK